MLKNLEAHGYLHIANYLMAKYALGNINYTMPFKGFRKSNVNSLHLKLNCMSRYTDMMAPL